MLYILIFIILLYFVYKYDYKGKKSKKWTNYYILMIVLIVIAGLRYRLGIDSIRYEEQYKDFPTLGELSWNKIFYGSDRIDPLFFVLSSICKTLSPNFSLFQFVHATIVNWSIFYFFRRYTKKIYFAVFCYYIALYSNFMCEVMRESLAVSSFLIGWCFLDKKKYWKSALFLVAAFLFHSSAIILLIIPFLQIPAISKFLVINKRTIVFLFCFLLLVQSVHSYLFEYLNILDFSATLTEKVNRYKNGDLAGQNFSFYGVLSCIIKWIIYPIWAVVGLKKCNAIQKNTENMIFLCLIFAVATIPVTLFYRYNNYFMLFSIVAISEYFFSEYKYRPIVNHSFGEKILVFFPFVFIYIYSYFATVDNTNLKTYMRYYPYNSVIDPQKNENTEKIIKYYVD